MSHLSEMESVLQQLTSEGDLAARGQFTLDPSRSHAKIAQYLTVDRASWSYWLVRAARAFQAASGDLQLGRDSVACRFDLPQEAAAAVADWLDAGTDPGNHTGLDLLRTSLLWLQALLESDNLRAALVLSGKRSGLWELGVDEIRRTAAQPDVSEEGLSVVVQGAGLQRMRNDMAAHLPARLQFAPFPLKMDGRPLSAALPSGELLYARLYLGAAPRGVLGAPAPSRLPARNYRLGNSPPFSRPRFSAPASVVPTLSVAGVLPAGLKWSQTEGHPVLSWHQGNATGTLHLHGLADVPAGEPWGAWLLPLALMRRAETSEDTLRLVDRGVALDEQEIRLRLKQPVGWKAWVAWDGVQTDLSGTRPVQSEELQGLLNWLGREIELIHSQMSETG